MTTEIVVLNPSAVALAADSIATVSNGTESRAKTHEVNKLFTLSKHHPVGVLVYGGGSLLGIPWETAIKVFRRELGTSACPTVREYAERFCDFLGSKQTLFNDQEQRQWFTRTLLSFFFEVAREIDVLIQNRLSESPIPESEITSQVRECLRSKLQEFSSTPIRKHLPLSFETSLATDYSTEIDDAIRRGLDKKPLDSTALRLARELSVKLFCHQNQAPNMSGIVIAGFGDKELYPVVHSLKVYGAANGSLIYDVDENGCFSDLGAAVMPFAQRDVADTFLFGMDPADRNVITDYLTQVFNQFPEIIAGNLTIQSDEKDKLTESLKRATEAVVKDFNSRLNLILKKRHTDPLLQVLQFLPKESLAEIAESLVSLTTLKRKVSQGLETVGGPVDVAVISKGDGFVWIRRKHYFDPKINPTFFANYFSR